MNIFEMLGFRRSQRHDPAIELRIVSYNPRDYIAGTGVLGPASILFQADCEEIRQVRKYGSLQAYDMDSQDQLWGSLLYPVMLGIASEERMFDVQVRLVQNDRKDLHKWT